MSKTIKNHKPLGAEYWSRRPVKGDRSPGRRTKQITHRLERRAAQREISEEIEGM